MRSSLKLDLLKFWCAFPEITSMSYNTLKFWDPYSDIKKTGNFLFQISGRYLFIKGKEIHNLESRQMITLPRWYDMITLPQWDEGDSNDVYYQILSSDWNNLLMMSSSKLEEIALDPELYPYQEIPLNIEKEILKLEANEYV